MTKQTQLRRGTSAEHGSFVGGIAELTAATDTKALWLHDGVGKGRQVTGEGAELQAPNARRGTTQGAMMERLICLEDWADPSGTTDATDDIQAAADFARAQGKKLWASGGEFLFSGQTLNLREVKLDLDCTLRIPAGDTTSYLTLGGNASSRNNNKQYIKTIASDTRTIDQPSCVIAGAKGQHITVESAEALQLFADNADVRNNYSIAYCTFILKYVKRLDIYGAPQGSSSQAGWINENKFYLNSCADLRVGRDDDDTYKHNNNQFYGGTFEGGGLYEFNHCYRNTMHDIRLESYEDTKGFVFRAGAEENKVHVSWLSSVAAAPGWNGRYVDLGISNLIAAADEGMYTRETLATVSATTVNWDAVDKAAVSHDCIRDRGIQKDPSVGTEYAATALTVTGQKLSLPTWTAFYRSPLVPVPRGQDAWFWLSMAGRTDDTSGYRAILTGYDVDGVEITPTASDVLVQGRGALPFGGLNTVNRPTDQFRIINQDCAYIALVVYSGNKATEFMQFNWSVRRPATQLNTWEDETRAVALTSNPASLAGAGMDVSQNEQDYFYFPLVPSHGIGANSTLTDTYDMTGKLPKDFSNANYMVTAVPVPGATPLANGVHYTALIENVNELAIRQNNFTDASVSTPSGVRMRVRISPVSGTLIT